LKLFGIPIRRSQIVSFGGDLVVVTLALYLGHFLRLGATGTEVSLAGIFDLTTGASAFFIITHVGLLYVVGGYDADQDYPLFALIPKLWLGSVAAFIIQMAIFYAAPNWQWGRGVTLIGFVSFTGLLTAWRAVAHRFIKLSGAARRTIIFGGGEAAEEVGELLVHKPDVKAAHELLGFVCNKEKASDTLPAEILGEPAQLLDVIASEKVSQVIVASPGHFEDATTKALLDLKGQGVSIVDMATFFKDHTGRVPIHHLLDTWMIFAPGFGEPSRLLNFTTRLFDIVFSLLLGLGTLPVMIIAVIAVKLSSKGPAVYSQERLGINREPFTIYKLRTMRQDAEAKSGAVWSKGAGDPRVTSVGRFLRRSRIDELPQLWNVLRGDMALVGPRPEREHFVNMLEEEIPYYGLRFAAKPGVTGWAQISFGYGASVDDASTKLEYELYAIQEGNPVLYLIVLVKTVQTVLFRPGS